MSDRRTQYLENLYEDVVQVLGEDSYTAKDLRAIMEYWRTQPADDAIDGVVALENVLRTEVAGLKTEVIRRQGRQPWMDRVPGTDRRRFPDGRVYQWDPATLRWTHVEEDAE